MQKTERYSTMAGALSTGLFLNKCNIFLAFPREVDIIHHRSRKYTAFKKEEAK